MKMPELLKNKNIKKFNIKLNIRLSEITQCKYIDVIMNDELRHLLSNYVNNIYKYKSVMPQSSQDL